MKRYNLFMDDERLKQLREHAAKEETTVSELIRRAVDELLKLKDAHPTVQ